MEQKILHLYPELMSLYGEYANVAVLRRHLEDLGVSVTVTGVTFENEPDFSGADMIYMGAGTERSQKAVLADMPRYADGLKAAVEDGTLLLFTGNAMEVIGKSVTDAAGKVHPALGLADFSTVETDRRTPHDVIAVSTLWEERAVGFMNKCSRTSGVTSPLFSSLPMGFGNDVEGGGEGYVSGNVFATHITGPVLVKNPAFTALLIRRLFARRGWELPAELPAYPYEAAAYAVTLKELTARLGG